MENEFPPSVSASIYLAGRGNARLIVRSDPKRRSVDACIDITAGDNAGWAWSSLYLDLEQARALRSQLAAAIQEVVGREVAVDEAVQRG